MKDEDRTKPDLIKELSTLREKVGKLETAARHYEKELKMARQLGKQAPFQDHVTKLFTQEAFDLLANHQLRIAESKQREMIMLYARLKDYEEIESEHGAQEADAALLDAADVVRETFRKSDVIGRIGKDGFIVLAVEAAKSMSKKLTSRLERNVEAFKFEENKPYEFSMSMGTAGFDPETPCTIKELITRARPS